MRGLQAVSFVLGALLLVACRPEGTTPVNPREVLPRTTIGSTSQPVVSEKPYVSAGAEGTVVTGQTIYVPIYSHIYFQNQSRTLNLTATLSIRNSDLTHSHYRYRSALLRYAWPIGTSIRGTTTTACRTGHNRVPCGRTRYTRRLGRELHCEVERNGACERADH